MVWIKHAAQEQGDSRETTHLEKTKDITTTQHYVCHNHHGHRENHRQLLFFLATLLRS